MAAVYNNKFVLHNGSDFIQQMKMTKIRKMAITDYRKRDELLLYVVTQTYMDINGVCVPNFRSIHGDVQFESVSSVFQRHGG